MVKLTFSILVFLTSTAAAEKLTLSAVPAVDGPPSVVGSYAVCKDTSSHIRTARLDVQGHEVDMLTDCARTHSQIALQSKTGWFVFASGDVGSESTTFASIQKKRALLHRIDTSSGEGDALRRASRIDVCTFNDKDIPLCGAVEVECPETGCKVPEIVKGALWLHAKGGRKKFTIEQAK